MGAGPRQERTSAEIRADSQAAIERWRANRDEALAAADAQTCERCGGTGQIATWCGRRGEGGKVGPCPRCAPNDEVKQFVTRLAAENFGDPRERNFNRAFTKGEEHGRGNAPLSGDQAASREAHDQKRI